MVKAIGRVQHFFLQKLTLAFILKLKIHITSQFLQNKKILFFSKKVYFFKKRYFYSKLFKILHQVFCFFIKIRL